MRINDITRASRRTRPTRGEARVSPSDRSGAARPVGMSALGIAGSLAGTAVKTAVNRSINQYQERRLDQQSKVDWYVRAIPGPAVGGSARNARSTRAYDDHSRRHERFPATRSRRRERETEHAPPPRGQPPARATIFPHERVFRVVTRTFSRIVSRAAAFRRLSLAASEPTHHAIARSRLTHTRVLSPRAPFPRRAGRTTTTPPT